MFMVNKDYHYTATRHILHQLFLSTLQYVDEVVGLFVANVQDC